MMFVLSEAGKLLSSPQGSLVYHLLLLWALWFGWGMARGEWRRSRQEPAHRLLLAMGGLLLLRIVYVAGSLFASGGRVDPVVLLPPLEHAVDAASLALLAWAYMPPARQRGRLWDQVLGAILLAIILGSAALGVFWSRELAVDGALSYNGHWQAIVGSAVQLGLAVLAIAAVLRSRPAGWGTLAAALLLLILLSIPALKLSPFRFAHPLWVTLIAVCLFCAQLAPTLYTGNYLGDGRVLNTYYYTYVLMLAQLALYWTGHILRKREHGLAPLFIGAPLPEGQEAAPSQTASLSPSGYAPEQRLKAAALMLAGIMLAVGCVAYRPDGAPSYGPQNMASGSAVRALVSGQAARYDAAMDTREALLSDPALSEVTLVPVTDAPRNFMGDALSGENLEYVLRLYADYYDKVAVHAAEQGE